MPASDQVYINIIADAAKSIAGIAKLGAAFYAANKIFKTAVRIGTDLIDSYKAQEQAEAKLTAALRATGRQYDISIRGLSDYASELQTLTTYGDEATISAMAMLQQLGDLDEQGLRKLTPLVQDFATAMGVDLQTAASLVGKTLGSTTNALSRYGVLIDATAPKEQKLAELVATLDKKFGGFAQTVAQTGTGAMEQLNNIMSDIKEEGGKALLDMLKPGIQKMTEFLTKTLQAWSAQRNLNMALKGQATSVYEVDKALDEQNKRIAEAAIKRSDLIKTVWDAQVAFDKERKKVEAGTSALSTNIAQATVALQNAKDRLSAQEKLIAEGSKNIKTLQGEREELAKINDIESARVKLLRAEEEAEAATAAAVVEASKKKEEATGFLEELNRQSEVFRINEENAWVSNWEAMREHNEIVGVEAPEAYAKAAEAAEEFGSRAGQMLGPFTDALGTAIVDSEKGWEMFKDAAKDAIAGVLEMLAKEAFVKAALAFPNIPAMIAYGAAGTAALIAAGAVKAMAEGGIVTGPTQALIGEAGPEAVIPLSRAGGMLGNRVVVHVYGSVMEEEGLARRIGALVGKQRRGY